jgi:hypothetical protein
MIKYTILPRKNIDGGNTGYKTPEIDPLRGNYFVLAVTLDSIRDHNTTLRIFLPFTVHPGHQARHLLAFAESFQSRHLPAPWCIDS